VKLYEKINNGDRRTIVMHLNKGEEIRTTDGVIILNANVKVKVLQEFSCRGGAFPDGTAHGVWRDKTVFIDDAVEVPEPRDDRPPPTSIPAPADLFDRGIPFAQARPRSWWERIFGSGW
jgi:hypothetical protein